MKKILLILLFIPLVGFGQSRKIKVVEINEKGYEVDIQFSPIVEKVSNEKLSISILPISANILNDKLNIYNELNGKLGYSKYSNSISSYIIKRQNKKGVLVRDDFEMLDIAIDTLRNKNNITEVEYGKLKRQIYQYFFQEIDYETNKFDRSISSNPYYIDGRYLSVFEIEITNLTDKTQIFDSEINITASTDKLKPISKEKLVTLLEYDTKLNIDKLFSIERIHLPKVVEVPSNSKVRYYFACLPINFNSKFVKIQIVGFETQFEWKINNNYTSLNKLNKYYEFNISHNFRKTDYLLELIFIEVNDSENSLIYDGSQILINQNSINKEIEVIGLFLLENSVFFGRNKISGAKYLDFNKKRREKIPIDFNITVDVERNIK